MYELSRVFTLLVDGKPTLAFEARNTQQAQEIRKEHWMRSDLQELKSNGTPLGTASSHLSVRLANQEECSTYAKAAAEVASEQEDIVLAYLIELDGTDGGM
jgi:hypothetical protein